MIEIDTPVRQERPKPASKKSSPKKTVSPTRKKDKASKPKSPTRAQKSKSPPKPDPLRFIDQEYVPPPIIKKRQRVESPKKALSPVRCASSTNSQTSKQRFSPQRAQMLMQVAMESMPGPRLRSSKEKEALNPQNCNLNSSISSTVPELG